jgi:hypothetical protein
VSETITIAQTIESVTVSSTSDTIIVSDSGVVGPASSGVNRLASYCNTAGSCLKQSALLDSVSGGVLTIAATLTADRTATFPNAAITVAGINLAQTFTATQTFAAINATSIGATTPGTIAGTTITGSGVLTVTDTTEATSVAGSIRSSGGISAAKGILSQTWLDAPLLRLPHGATPSVLTNGDLWTTTSGLFVRVNGSTVGPLVPYVHPNHSGDVTSAGDGAQTIAANAVSNTKMADMAQSTIKGRAAAAGTGDPTDLTAAQARTILNVADGATNTPLSSTTPAAVGTAAVGTGTTAARADHVHAHGDQSGGTLHSVASTGAAGFMSATDKAKLDTYRADANTMAACLRANVNVGGGGTITVDGSGYVKWSTRFVVMSNGRGTFFGTDGHFDISCPTSGTVTGVGGAPSVTATAAGIPLASWTALYYILPIGSGNASVAANFRVARFNTDLVIPDDWILIAIRNIENGRVYLPGGYSLLLGQSIDTANWDAYAAAIAGNADLLDGQHATDFAAASHTSAQHPYLNLAQTFTATQTFAAITGSGVLTVTNTTEATSSAGSIVTSGGISAAKSIYTGGNIAMPAGKITGPTPLPASFADLAAVRTFLATLIA